MMLMMSYGWIGLIVLVLIIYLILSLTDEKAVKKNKDGALHHLDIRYAKGEITEEEYKKIKKIIKKK